jgi:hypothetical protein
VELPLDQLTRVTLDNSGSMGRTVAMGVAIGVGAGFGIFLLLVALIAD